MQQYYKVSIYSLNILPKQLIQLERKTTNPDGFVIISYPGDQVLYNKNQMNRIDRLFGILTILQSKKYVTADQIANKFEISIRTVYRDIKALSESGIPVSFEQPKGYFIVQGFFLPPLSLTIEEANALILMTSLAEKFADKSITRHSKSAITKLLTILRYSDKDKAEIISSNTYVYLPDNERIDAEYLSIIQQSITEKIILEIEYTNNQGIFSKREIEPIGLAFYSNQWHLIAWCWKRNQYIDFKTRMISKLIKTPNTFRNKSHWTIHEYFKSLL
jgi:predicted DNA-binding transcriptional regulator YafY